MNRRQLLATAGAFGATAALSGTAFAAEHAHDGHAGHQGHAHASPGENKAVVMAARDCVTTGEACLDHCLMLFQMGDTSIADCAAQVNMMIPISETLARFANVNAPSLKDLAVIAVKVYEDCEKACLEHAEHHIECKRCADSCTGAIEACRTLLQA